MSDRPTREQLDDWRSALERTTGRRLQKWAWDMTIAEIYAEGYAAGYEERAPDIEDFEAAS